MVSLNPTLKTIYRKQRTLGDAVSFSGIGIHTGAKVTMTFVPADEGTGIVFRRTDLPNKLIIPATIAYVCDTARSTTLGLQDVRVHTVEHVLAALKAFDIDNCIIEVSNVEPPVGNGSSDIFVEMIESVGIMEQGAHTPIIKLNHPVYYSEKDIQIVALPYDGYRISYTLSYPASKALKSQFQSFEINSETFKREIAPCRTFSLYEEVATLMDRGLIRGGSLDNAVIIKEDVIFSKGGLFFPDEMCRHKMLDMVGDLSLVGYNFNAHIIAIRAGHPSNFAFAKQLFQTITRESST
jgi:UDP-3-O-[3-hydroxymyristoyl] N-acetylglucosamine deacetylase